MNLSQSFQTAFSGLSFIARRPLPVAAISLLGLIALGLVFLPNIWMFSYPAPTAPAVSTFGTSERVTIAQSRIQAIEQLRDSQRNYYASNIAKWEKQLKNLPPEYAAPGAPESYGQDRHLTGSDIRGVIADFKRRQAMDEDSYQRDISGDADLIRQEQTVTRQGMQQSWSINRRSAYAADRRGMTTIVKGLSILGLILLFLVQVVGLSAVLRGEGGGAEAAGRLLRIERKELSVATFVGLLMILYAACVVISLLVLILVLAGAALLLQGNPSAGWLELFAFLGGPISAVAGLVIWLMLALRLGPCLPMAFYEEQFDLRRAWSLTKENFRRTLVSNVLIAVQLACIALGILVTYHILFNVPLSSAASPAVMGWTPPTPAQALFTYLALGMTFGPATAIVAAPLARFYRATASTQL